jgi:hypothetical protein
MSGFFFWVDYVLRLSISPEICPNQRFLGVTNLQYVLFKAIFGALYFFVNFPCTF